MVRVGARAPPRMRMYRGAVRVFFRLIDDPEQSLVNFDVPDNTALPRLGETVDLFEADNATYRVQRVRWAYPTDTSPETRVVFIVSREPLDGS